MKHSHWLGLQRYQHSHRCAPSDRLGYPTHHHPIEEYENMQLVYDPDKVKKTMCNLPIAVDPGCNCRDDRESPCDCYSRLEGAEIQRDADLTVCQSLLDSLESLIKVQGCTCGARSESPQTHPHVLRCKIAEAIDRAKGQLSNT